MSSIFCRCNSNKENYLSINNELKNIYNILDKLLNENRLLKTRFDKLEDIYQRWIGDERFYLLKHIEKLENENHQFYEIYQTYEKSLQSIINLIIKILLTQQELRKQYTERHNANDPVQWREKQQQNGSITRNTRSISCQFASNQSNDSRYSINDQSIWLHQVKEQDQKTTNYSSESTLATTKSKSEKSSTALANKLYYVINNEETPIKSIRDNRRSPGNNIIPVDESKQHSSVTLKKNESQTRSTYSNHERLSTQTPYRTSPIVKNTPTKTTSISKSPRVPTIKIRPPTTNTRSNQKTVSTTNKSSSRPRLTLPKSSEPIRSIGATTTHQPITNKPRISPTKNTNKTRIPIVTKQSTRVPDLDVLMAESDKPKIISPSSLIKPSLFSKDSFQIVRPVRSQELKLFSCHLIPEKSYQTNESLSTLTPSSYESINDNQLIEKQTSNILDVIRDFSEDSLNEHYHIKKLLKLQDHSSNDNIKILSNQQENIEMINKEGYFLSNPSSSSLIHRLVFPTRLGRMIFTRRILSDSDIYQKICSKDSEIVHNVYHLDTTRDYSMEFYMLTTYASDSQLRAWIDSDDDEVIGHFNENRFLSSDGKINENSKKKINSSDNLIQDEELDWYSELDYFNLTNEKQEINSSEIHIEKFFPIQQTSTDSTDLASVLWTIPPGGSNQFYSTPLPSNRTDRSNSILQEILNHSWTDHLSTSNSIQQETGIEQFEDDSTSSIITDEFQPDFYYLCPITKTTSFSQTDSKT